MPLLDCAHRERHNLATVCACNQTPKRERPASIPSTIRSGAIGTGSSPVAPACAFTDTNKPRSINRTKPTSSRAASHARTSVKKIDASGLRLENSAIEARSLFRDTNEAAGTKTATAMKVRSAMIGKLPAFIRYQKVT